MPRIAGTDVPDKKKVEFALRSVYGIGPKRASDLIKAASIDASKRAKDLTSGEIGKLQKLLEKIMVEGDLRRVISGNINRLKRIRSYRGLRHTVQLPCRGQRTRVNARTVRKKKRATVGAMSKAMAAKLEAAKKKK